MCCDHIKSTHYNTIDDIEGYSSRFYKCDSCNELFSTIELRLDLSPISTDLDMLQLAKKLIAMTGNDRGLIMEFVDKYFCRKQPLH